MKEELVRGFRCKTSSEHLWSFVCASCTASYVELEKHTIPLDEVDLDLFRCPPELKAYIGADVGLPRLSDTNPDILLRVDPGSATMLCCKDCTLSVRRGKCPSLAIANLNFLGCVPQELRDLTFIKEQIVALCRAKCTIVHLKDSSERENSSGRNNDFFDSCSPNDQWGFKEHIIVYPQQPGKAVSILPPPVQDIVNPVCIIFVGSKAPTLEWLRKKAKPLVVQQDKVRAALYWLKAHNPLYKDVQISEPHLAALPVDDLLPVDVEHVAPSAAQDVLTSRYNAESLPPHPNVSGASESPEADLLPSAHTIKHAEAQFSKVVVTDVDGRAPSNELRAAAIRHVKDKGGVYLEVPHGPRPVNKFCNPVLFPQIYPCLFPYGIDGFEDNHRQTSLGFQKHVRHLLTLADSHFCEHHSFMFTAFNILQRRAILLHSSLKVCKAWFASVAAEYASVSDATIVRVCAQVASSHCMQAEDDKEWHILKLMNDIQLVTRQVPGLSGARLAM